MTIRLFKNRTVTAATICMAAGFCLASYFRIFDSYELGSLDARFLLRARQVPVSDKIVIIEIGEDTIRKLGRFPFDRGYYALAVRALSEYGAKSVVVDLLFSEPHSDDAELAAAMKDASNVYLSYAFDIKRGLGGDVITADGYLAGITEKLAESTRGSGHINIVPDMDGKVRRAPLLIRYNGSFYPYVSVKAACDYLGIPEAGVSMDTGRYLKLGDYARVPLDDRSEMMVNFSGRWGTRFKHYSFVDILQSYASRAAGQPGKPGPEDFNGKICIIGLTAAGTSDIHPNPFETMYPGMGMHAEVINSILNKDFITRAGRTTNIAVILILCAAIALLTISSKPTAGFLYLAAAMSVYTALAVTLFDLRGIWIDIACPVFAASACYLACTLYKYVNEWKERLVLESELGIAKKIQESFLPKALPATAGLDISAKMLTARQVGGDLYDFIEFSDTRLGVMIGDVSGKGVPASLFMAMVAGAFKFYAAADTMPNDTLRDLNRKLVKESSSGLFVTAFNAIFDMRQGRMLYGIAGHPPALFLRGNEPPKFLDTDEGTPLGLMESGYSAGSVDIRKGDIVIFYTDGVTEAMNGKRELYGEERLSMIALQNRSLGSEGILKAIERDLRSFEPASDQHDDITMIVTKIK